MSGKLLLIPMIGAALVKGCIKAEGSLATKFAPKVAVTGAKYYALHENNYDSEYYSPDTYVAGDSKLPPVDNENYTLDMAQFASDICAEDSEIGKSLVNFQDTIVERYKRGLITKDEVYAKEKILEKLFNKVIRESFKENEMLSETQLKSLFKHCHSILYGNLEAKLKMITPVEHSTKNSEDTIEEKKAKDEIAIRESDSLDNVTQ
jgi:hypothetical protein